jgi:DNA primase
LFKVNALASQFYHEQLRSLPSGHEARKYLVTRGLTDELVNMYKIGYAPEAWSELATYFEDKKVPVNAAEQVGLLKRRTGGKSGHYDLFRHRLMFPIFSPTGQCLGFGGRVLSKEQQPKYLNSPDSAVFHKGKVFYGLDHSAKYIRAEDEVIVVEGYMDWLALAKVSVNNIVATLGTALTHDHAKLMKRYTQKVIVLFDGDEAGRSAAARSLPILLSEGLHARGLFLPEELDPDEYIAKYGVAELRKLLSGAPDLFELVSTQAWLKNKGKPSGKVELIDEFTPVLAATADIRVRSLYIDGFANMLDINRALIDQSVKRALSGAPRPQSQPKPAAKALTETPPAAAQAQSDQPQIDLNKVPRAELELLNVILMKEVYLKEALNSDVADKFAHPGAKQVFARIAEVYRQMPNKFDTLSSLLAGEVKPVEAITLHLSELFTGLSGDAATKLVRDCIKRIKEKHFLMKSKELGSTLRAGPANPSDQLEQIMNIHKNRRSLNRDS